MMTDEINSSQHIKPVFFRSDRRRDLAEKTIVLALGEIGKDDDVLGKFRELAFHRSIEAGNKATAKANEIMNGNQSGVSAWLYSTGAQLLSGAKPEDFGKQVKTEFQTNKELTSFVEGMTKLGTASQVINKLDKNIVSDPSKIDDVFEALGKIGRSEKPNKESISAFFNTRKENVKSSDLDDDKKQSYLEKFSKQEEKMLETINSSSDIKVDVRPEVLEHLVRLDPDFKEFYNPINSLGALDRDMIENRSKKAIEDGFPEKAIKPDSLNFSSNNIDSVYNKDTYDAAQGIKKVLEPFEESDGGFAEIAKNLLIKGLDEEITKAVEK